MDPRQALRGSRLRSQRHGLLHCDCANRRRATSRPPSHADYGTDARGVFYTEAAFALHDCGRERTIASSAPATTTRVIEQTSINTGLTYEGAISAFERSIGRLDVPGSQALRARAASWSEVKAEMARMAGPSGLTLFTHFDQGSIATLAGRKIRCRIYLIGNPAIATQIVCIDVRGSFYVPFRVAIFQEDDASGAVILFDRPSSFLAVLEHPELKEFGLALDAKIDAVVQRVKNP